MNNMNERWLRWKPIKELANKYYIDGVLDTMEGFKIELSQEGKGKKAFVIFEDSVLAYRSTDESYRLKILDELSRMYGSTFFGFWTFFKVENSRYIQWLSEQSYEIIDSPDLIHFSFIAADSILDVVTNYDPIVEIVNEQ